MSQSVSRRAASAAGSRARAPPVAAHGLDAPDVPVGLVGIAVGFQEQQRRLAPGPVEGQQFGHEAEAGPVHELHGGRGHAAGHDGRHGGHGGPGVGEKRGHGPHLARMGNELDRQFGDDAEGAFRADEKAGQVVADHALAGGHAGPDDLTVGQHGGKPQHVVAGDAVLDAGRPAGIGGGVAAERAGGQAGRIGRIEKAHGPGGVAQGLGDDPRFGHGAEVAGVHGQDAVHGGGDQDHPALRGHGPAGKAGAGPARHDGKAVPAGQAQEPADFAGALGVKDGLGPADEA